MKRLIVALLALVSFTSARAACDNFTISANGCFLEIYCVKGATSTLQASLHLNSLTYIQRGTTTFDLEDAGGRAFSGDINKVSAFATITALFAFIDPLRNACQGEGVGGTLNVSTSTVQLFEKCDDNGGVLTKFWYRQVSDGSGAGGAVTTVRENGTAYTPTGTIVDCTSGGASDIYQLDKELVCLDITTDTIQAWHYSYRTNAGTMTYEIRRASDNTVVTGTIIPCTGSTSVDIYQLDKELVCLDITTDTIQAWHYTYRTNTGALTYEIRRASDNTVVTGTIINCTASPVDCKVANEPGNMLIVNGTFTFTANTYASISFVVESGTANITVNGGAAIPRSVGEAGSSWTASACEFLTFPIIIDATGGGTVYVNFIK